MESAAFPPLPAIKGCFPFRLGVTSYVYPADILPNVEALAPAVDDVQLILFQSDENSNLPDKATIDRLAELGRAHALSYTVHFPIDRRLGSESATERTAMLDRVLSILDLTAPLHPFAFNLHLEGIAADASPERLACWQRDLHPLLGTLTRRFTNPLQLCIENLNYPFAWCEPLIADFGLGICLDYGHLVTAGESPIEFLERHRLRVRTIHFHGIRDARDHVALTHLPDQAGLAFLRALKNYAGVLTLEVFEFNDTRDSMEALSAWHRTVQTNPG